LQTKRPLPTDAIAGTYGLLNFMYRTFEHTADLGLVVEAADLNALFAEAGRGFLSILVENPKTVRPTCEANLEIKGAELDYLLFDWLNELLFHFERDHLLLSEFDVTVGELGLKAKARGEVLDCQRHELSHEVKAITYHQLEVKQADNGWQARVIVDI
jgi:SHS2 domain-containing protein